jgi:hypothetical protein
VTQDDSAVELFRRLRRLLAEGRIALNYDFRRLQHMDCPVGSEADGNLWAYAIFGATALALWRGGWWAALVAGAAGIALYGSAGRAYVRRRIRRRIDERALGSLEMWQKLWRFGGIGLVAGGEACAAPQGNWMELVRSIPPAP